MRAVWLSFILFASGAWSPVGESVAQTRVFLTKEQAVERVLHGADSVRERVVSLSEEEAGRLAGDLGLTILEREYVFHEAIEGGRVARRAVIMNVLGQHQPITFVVGILPEGSVEHVEIMVYRESRGGEVRRGAFLRQFEEKSLDDPLALNGDIVNITGATISSRSVTRGVRLALVLHARLLETQGMDAGQ